MFCYRKRNFFLLLIDPSWDSSFVFADENWMKRICTWDSGNSQMLFLIERIVYWLNLLPSTAEVNIIKSMWRFCYNLLCCWKGKEPQDYRAFAFTGTFGTPLSFRFARQPWFCRLLEFFAWQTQRSVWIASNCCVHSWKSVFGVPLIMQ